MAVVDDAARQRAVQSRLDALENDHAAQDTFGLDSDDEEFVMENDEDEGGLQCPQWLVPGGLTFLNLFEFPEGTLSMSYGSVSFSISCC